MADNVQTVGGVPSQMHELVPFAEPLVKAAVEKWLVPKIKKVARSRELKRNARPDRLKPGFEEYLVRTYGRLSFMNTIVFGNQQKRIQDLYIPLTVRARGGKEESFEISGWLDEFIPAYKRVVITDTAGMGKSTILKWLFLSALGMSKGIPIFVELRTLSSRKTLLDRIYEELSAIDKRSIRICCSSFFVQENLLSSWTASTK